MKRTLYFILFSVGLLMFSGEAKAQQTLREPLSDSQKSDDGVLVAYPNPTRDFIIVKAAGGVRTPEEAEYMINLGVKRIGTSSAKALIKNEEVSGGY